MLFLSQAGYRIIFAFRQYQIREEVKQQLLASLPETALDIVDAGNNKEAIDWEEEGREFYLHGQIYDVAFTKNVNGRILIYCLNDKREDKLLKDLNKLLYGNTNKPGSNHPAQQEIKFQSPDFILLAAEPAALLQQQAEQKYFYRAEKLTSAITELITPPPDQKSKHQTEIL